MQTYDSILVVLDKPKHEQWAMQRAFDLQSKTGANLRLVSFCWNAMGEPGAVFDSLDAQQLRSAMLSADLLVIGTAANKGLTGVLLANSAERILTKAPCDVRVIKPQDLTQ
ncbi:MAG: universal stress protein [Gammaproteobacteria bacterium]|nr:universal stress protein [Gammaproteobacteria bacterium]